MLKLYCNSTLSANASYLSAFALIIIFGINRRHRDRLVPKDFVHFPKRMLFLLQLLEFGIPFLIAALFQHVLVLVGGPRSSEQIFVGGVPLE